MKFLVFYLLLITSLIPQNLMAQEKDKPLEGEGIQAFLRRHNRPGKENYDKFIELNKKKLGEKLILKTGIEYYIPSLESISNLKGTKRTESLFGEKYAEYTIESEVLKDACFFVVSGHGGPDCGAIGKRGTHELHEDEYAYDIMLRLARELMINGATVYIIIQDPDDGIRDEQILKNSKTETCRGAEIPLNQVERLKQRSDTINAISRKTPEKYQRAIFIHLDSRTKKKRLDVFFYHYENSPNGEILANTMKETFKEQYDIHQPNRGFSGTVSPRNLYVLHNTRPVGIYAELGNIQNDFDQQRFILNTNRQALAKWLCRGFIKDYEDYKQRNTETPQ